MNLDIVLWLTYIAVEAALVGLLIYRRVWRTLPVFFAYCIWDIVGNLAVYATNRYFPANYFYAFFIGTTIDAAFLLCVLVELTWSVLRPLRSSLSRRALVVVVALILLAGAVIWPFASVPNLSHLTSRIGLIFAQLQQTTSFLRILFFLVLAAGSQLLSIGWRDRELQVATGLGFYSIVSVSISMLQVHLTAIAQFRHLNQFLIAGFLCTLFYWIVSFAQKEAERREFTPQMQNFLLAVAGAARSTRIAFSDTPSNKPLKNDDRYRDS